MIAKKKCRHCGKRFANSTGNPVYCPDCRGDKETMRKIAVQRATAWAQANHDRYLDYQAGYYTNVRGPVRRKWCRAVCRCCGKRFRFRNDSMITRTTCDKCARRAR